MEPRSLTLALLLHLLLVSADHHHSTPSPPPSPPPSPSPSLSHHLTTPKNEESTILQFSPPPDVHLPHHHGPREHHPGKSETLNLGEKVGMAFLAVALALQVALGGFLVFKRLQLRKMEREDRRMAELPSVASP